MKTVLFSLSVMLLVLTPATQSACSISGCGSGGETWTQTAQAFIDSDVPIVGVTSGQPASSSFSAGNTTVNATASSSASSARAAVTTTKKVAGVYVAPGSRADQFPAAAARILKALDALSVDEVAVDVSDSRSAGQAHLRGAVGIPYRAFFYENGSLRSIPELASLLGSAGISEKDDLMIYSDTFASGEATAVLWALKYLGHEQARALDGGLDNWIGASLPLESLEASFARTAVYNASPKIELLADYDYVISGRAQPVDARDFLEWGETRIDNATWISSEGVLADGRLRRGEELNATFARLEKGRPVVVYSDDIREASVVWFALRVMGYDARIYRWVG